MRRIARLVQELSYLDAFGLRLAARSRCLGHRRSRALWNSCPLSRLHAGTLSADKA